jgi:phosphoribosylanthranilate isomerase
MAERSLTKIKICGITNLDDAIMAAELGADAVGFIFTTSKREINPKIAREIIKKLPPFIKTVGVFKNKTQKNLNQIADYTKVDIVQLHGNETPEYCNGIKRKVIKRFSINDNYDTTDLVSVMNKYYVSAYLLDPGEGSGKKFDWNLATNINLPLIIAGGLTPENVKEVINLLAPYGVDVASGVEKSPGIKDIKKIKRFIEEVRS